MKSVKGIFIFVIGVVSGTFMGAQIAKKKYEEYVSFDELEVKEESKKDTIKNVAMFVGGLTLGMAIKPAKKIIQEHYHISIFK